MNILHLVNRVEDAGNGITNVAVDVACEQARLGHRVIVGSAGGSFVPLLAEAGVEHVHIDFTRRDPLAVLRAIGTVRRTVRGYGIDVVHVHTITPVVVARAAAPRTRLVATVHNEYQRGVSIMRIADVVVGVSEAVSESIRRWRGPRPVIRTVYNGVLGTSRRSGSIRNPVSPPTIVTIGAVSPRKGSDVLLDAFARVVEAVPQAELLFIGNVDWPEELRRREGLAYMSKVRFAGFERDPQRFLDRGTLFVMPSRRDPFPLALLEAMGAGCAIVGSDVDGIPEALGGGAAGIVVPPGDSVALAQALVDLLEHPELRSQYAAAALEASARFTVSTMASEYLDVYRLKRRP
ncbi:glycosyltransferase family 4 protein [Amnibacterium sp.]|uniref:glycosyltransferase family 4 protein n=1 Tax=Amnibacterium sp. TaxID=1872496 RepID=UPI00262B3AA6|nr:glycosyltransferase family 4 protein [Amnibacterium sp.]MCU1473899.1 hypothetical protein [Amnibacterium sp.]